MKHKSRPIIKTLSEMKKFHLLQLVVFSLICCVGLLHAQSNHNSYQYISPKPGAQLVSKETNIIVRPGEILSSHSLDIASLFKVEGSVSGIHAGDVIISDDQRTIIFKPYRAFEPGETVSISIERGLKTQDGTEIDASSFDFHISPKRGKLTRESFFYLEHGRAINVENEWNQNVQKNKDISPLAKNTDFSLPTDFPSITVNASDNPDPGYIFLSSFTFPFTVQYNMILDNSGFPIYFRKMSTPAFDLKVQSNGLLTYFDLGRELFYGMDASYTVVDSFQTGNGYFTDLHELQVLTDGHALLMSYDFQVMDMSQIVPGGDTAATVTGLIIQEIDQSKNVVFEWRSWDYFEITDATHLDFTESEIDYAHGNAIELDFDGNLLISSRNMDEITRINRQTGEIIWRLGGKNNQFTFVNDTAGFSYQHDIRRLPNGNITLYDNGNFHSPPYSRAVEYDLDEQNKTATLVWEYRNTPDTYGAFMGDVQRLSSGNSIIGWGGTSPTVTEVRSDGSKTLELTFDPGTWSYRAFRFPWSGVAAAPYLWADTSNEMVTLNFTKFGDTAVVKYYIYQAESPGPTTKVDSTVGNSIVITGLTSGITYHFRVTALDDQSNESPFSNEIAITPDFITGKEPLDGQIPKEYAVFQNYPNPFNPSTTIRYEVPKRSHIVLKIFNLLGQEVAKLIDEEKKPGRYEIEWQPTGMSSGIYLYRLQADEFVETKKLVLLK